MSPVHGLFKKCWQIFSEQQIPWVPVCDSCCVLSESLLQSFWQGLCCCEPCLPWQLRAKIHKNQSLHVNAALKECVGFYLSLSLETFPLGSFRSLERKINISVEKNTRQPIENITYSKYRISEQLSKVYLLTKNSLEKQDPLESAADMLEMMEHLRDWW